MGDLKGNLLQLSWHDTTWIPHLNPMNILDYFSERSNPFYDRTCNNEIVKMQKLSLDQLQNMTGLEYILLHVQEPILFVIRKQHRYSPDHVTPLADYYIIAGFVYQAPDLNSLISSRLASGIHNLLSAFEEAHSYTRYHPTKGYSWDFARDSADQDTNKGMEKKKEKQKEESSSAFQRARVDLLLGELMKKFPPKMPQVANASDNMNNKPENISSNGNCNEESNAISNGNSEVNVKSETSDRSAAMNGSNQNGMSGNNNYANRSISGIPEKKPRHN